MVVFTPNYLTYTGKVPDDMKVGAQVQNHRMGAIQNCTMNGTMTEVPGEGKTKTNEVVYGEDDCSLLNWKILTNQVFLAFLSTTAVAFFTLLGAFFTGIIKIILDWVPVDKIKAARILCSRNFGLGLMSAHITAGGFIIASTVCMIILWKMTLSDDGWSLGRNIFMGIGIAIASFVTAIMWFMDVKKVGLVPF